MELLQSLACEQDRAVVVVTHDPRLERYAKRVVVVEDGRLAASRAVGDPGMVSNSKNAGRDS
jgi:putative ABC transport system ATP-binding protein